MATFREAAKALYAAVRTDRAVQDAMLAALAAGGRLVEECEGEDECAGAAEDGEPR